MANLSLIDTVQTSTPTGVTASWPITVAPVMGNDRPPLQQDRCGMSFIWHPDHKEVHPVVPKQLHLAQLAGALEFFWQEGPDVIDALCQECVNYEISQGAIEMEYNWYQIAKADFEQNGDLARLAFNQELRSLEVNNAPEGKLSWLITLRTPVDQLGDPTQYGIPDRFFPNQEYVNGITATAEIVRWDFLKKYREKAVSDIVVEVDGMLFDGDEKSQERMARIILSVQDPDFLFPWKLANNTKAMINVGQLQQALAMAGSRQIELWF